MQETQSRQEFNGISEGSIEAGRYISYDSSGGYQFAPAMLPGFYTQMPPRIKKKDGLRKGKWTVRL